MRSSSGFNLQFIKKEVFNLNSIDIKAELLCNGLSADDDDTLMVFAKQKTGNNGCFVEFDGTNLLALLPIAIIPYLYITFQ